MTAPAHWKVVSNSPTPEPQAAGVADGVERATWSLRADAAHLLATSRRSSPARTTTSATRCRPARASCRSASSAASRWPQHLDADNIFDCTKQGFAFFESEFDQPYPFEKYDQLFMPEYNAGAMENAGAVTFIEVYVFRVQGHRGDRSSAGR